jgi:hypothetical protein
MFIVSVLPNSEDIDELANDSDDFYKILGEHLRSPDAPLRYDQH